jgi:hypothetical protein
MDFKVARFRARDVTGGGPETFPHGNAYSRRIHFGLPSFKNG